MQTKIIVLNLTLFFMPGCNLNTQETNLSFTLTSYDLSFIGVDLKRIVEPGDFKVMVGNEAVNFSISKQ